MLSNTLLGNSPYAPALEIALSGPIFRAERDVGMCVFGAPFQLERDAADVPSCTTFSLRRGQTLRIGGVSVGCRAYVCVRGGFHAPRVLGSSTGFSPIQAGQVLECDESQIRGMSLDPQALVELMPFFHVDSDPVARIRCLVGPQADWFDEAFFESEYSVAAANNRMGIRLDGPILPMPNRELVSEPVAPGAVQVANDGKPIVLGVDGQTIGGYPKIASVISADLDVLGQLRPGTRVRFQRVDEVEAETAGRVRRSTVARWIRRIEVGRQS